MDFDYQFSKYKSSSSSSFFLCFFSKTLTFLIVNIKNYETCLKEEDCKIRFNIANGMFIKKGYELTDQFKEICGNYNTSYFELKGAG